MKRKIEVILIIGIALLCFAGNSSATVLFQDGFETSWASDYAPGWENTLYRHGDAPVAQMMQQTSIAHSGSGGLELITADPLNLFWVGVNPSDIPLAALDRQYDPYLSAWYYEENQPSVAGQIFAVPDTPLDDDADWTDIQFGGRREPVVGEDFYYIAARSGISWVDTGIERTEGWHHLMMQLSSVDGKVYLYLDEDLVGVTIRDDYTNLGTVGLYTMFDAASLGTDGAGSSTIWDDVEIGSTVPEPATMLLFGCGLIGLAGISRKTNIK